VAVLKFLNSFFLFKRKKEVIYDNVLSVDYVDQHLLHCKVSRTKMKLALVLLLLSPRFEVFR